MTHTELYSGTEIAVHTKTSMGLLCHSHNAELTRGSGLKMEKYRCEKKVLLFLFLIIITYEFVLPFCKEQQ